MSELFKLRKIITKLERRYELAENKPLEQKRIMKRAIKIQARIDVLTEDREYKAHVKHA